MKNLIVLLAVFLIFQGCQKDDSILNSPGDQLLKVFTISGYSDGFTTNPFGNEAPYRHFVGNGQCTPGGNTQLELDYLITSFTPPNGTSGFGSAVLTTENGDKIYGIQAQGTWSITGTVVTFTASAVIAGGTGDYDNVKGTISYSGTLEQLTGATHAEWTGSFTREKPFAGSMTAENVTVNGSCNPGFIRRHAEGYGNAVHFGKVFGVVEHCIDFSTGIMTDGVGSLESPNGDKLFTAYNGYALPVPGTSTAAVSMFCTITGGTGRFENASGYLWIKAIQTMPSGAAECTFDGVIDY
jgi:hypothetical protein